MASDLSELKLNELVRDAITAELKAKGETTPGMIPRIIRAKYPEIASQYAEDLFDGAVSRKAAGQLKSWFAVSLSGETQLSLPGIPADVLAEIPPTITVPDGKNEPRHVLLSRVTVGEFKAWERMLADQIKADQRKHRAARFIVSKVKDLPDDAKLSEAFGAVREAAE
jgi:hypothetical protein